jgi:cyclopropane-fatty-acyl-phospholipid synthase
MLPNVLESALRELEFDKPFRIVLPDRRELTFGSGQPAFIVRVRTDAALRQCVRQPTLGFGEAYARGDIDVDGDLQDVVHLGFLLHERSLRPSFVQRIRRRLRPRSRRNTLKQVKKNVAAHYDVGNEFFASWLDAEMLYTCAYFQTPDDSLEEAQAQKMELICRKLRLQPGETVVEVGCGWGGLALYMARHFGVRVKAFNISRQQIEYARAKQKRLGIGTDRVDYILDDWRNVPAHVESCDKFAAVCMLEHVDPKDYARYFALVHRIVKRNSLAFIQFISRTAAVAGGNPWLERRVFPGNYNPSLAQIAAAIESEERALHIVDVENLRYHYALTMDHWTERFERHADRIRARHDEAFVRTWRLYLRAMAAGFRYGGTLLYQVLMATGYHDAAPLTRHHFLDVEARDLGATRQEIGA